MNKQSFKILLVDDDVDDYMITRNLLANVGGGNFQLEWEGNYTAAIKTIKECRHDIYLIDYRLGAYNGMDLVRLVATSGSKGLAIMLTGQGERRVDIEATRAGAVDYLVKAAMTSAGLERSLRHALERRQAAEALRQSEERYRALVSNVPGVVWEAWGKPDAATQRIDFVNDYVETMLGYGVEEWLSTPNFWLSIVHPDDRERTARQAAEAFDSGESGMLQFRWIAKDGRVVWVESYTVVIQDDSGWPIALRGVTIDISGRKHAEEALHKSQEQLRQSQKLEAIGQLAGGVAHDFNNLLTVILGYSQLLAVQLKEEELLRPYVEEIQLAGDRASSLTRQLLAFSRKQIMQPKILDLNVVVSEMEKMLRRVIGEDIELRTVLDPELGNIKADPGQVEQVILNLVVNARDAMPNGGMLTIEAQNVYFDEEYTANHIASIPGPYVRLAVSDSGTGMDKETQAHIFEPFFTTKAVGKGTGLGLSTVYGIVKQSGGNIWFYSEVDHGTVFKVYLPRVDESVQVSKPKINQVEGLRGSETILVAEDDKMVRNLVVGVLKTYGYQVLEAASGGGAFLICERHKEAIHLLLTDVIMPEMSGSNLAKRLAQLKPEMKVLYMSGYADKAIVNHGILDADKPFLQKPFTPDLLVHKIREVLDASQ